MLDETVEFVNTITGNTRHYPRILFDNLVLLCLESFPPADRDRVEAQLQSMIGDFLDSGDRAMPLLMAASAMFPDIPGIHFNLYPPEIIQAKILPWANAIFGRYGFPVWLVGSALTGAGRDVDIRVILPDEDFDARFPERKGLDIEVGKQGRLAALFCQMNIDFQIQKISECVQFLDFPRMRLDTQEPPESLEPSPADLGG